MTTATCMARTAVRAAEFFAARELGDRPALLALIPDGDDFVVYAPRQWRHQRIGLVDERALLRRRYAAALSRRRPGRRGPTFAGLAAGRRCEHGGVQVTVVERGGQLCDLHWGCCDRATVGRVHDGCSGLLAVEVLRELRGEPLYLRPLQQLAVDLDVDADGDGEDLHDRIVHAWEQGVRAPAGFDPALWALLGELCPGPRDLEELLTGVWRPFSTAADPA